MQSNFRLSGFVRQTLALTALFGASAVLAGAQTAAPKTLNLQLPAVQTTAAEPEFSSSVTDASTTTDAVETAQLTPHVDFLNAMQYGGRRSGRPRYRGGNRTDDGVPKYTFFAGAGLAAPTSSTADVNNLSYSFQVGVGRNFTKHATLNAQFDWDNFGLKGSTLNNQITIYNNPAVCPTCGFEPGDLDGYSHVWSLTLDPQYNIGSREGGLGAYVVGGLGFYHKITTFTTQVVEVGSDGFGDLEEFAVDAPFDSYTSNAFGLNGGFGLTYKFSRFSNEKLYAEVRYVWMDNSPRAGITVNNLAAVTASTTNFYPANSQRTTYIPVKVGIRF